MEIKIEKPMLDKATPEENMAIVHSWICDTADKMNVFIADVNREREKWNK